MKSLIRSIFCSLTILILSAKLICMCKQRNSKISNGEMVKNVFIPDSTYKSHFPWKDVRACFNKSLPKVDFKNHDKCPKCGMHSEDLIWIEFRSPDWTWKEFCGRQGPLSICPECKIQVEFITKVMN